MLTLLFLLCQNLQKISTVHCVCSFGTREAQKQDWRSEALTDFLQALYPSSGQSWIISDFLKLFFICASNFQKAREETDLNIWSSDRYCFKHLVSSLDDSESRPNGFSTMTLVHPSAEEARRLAHFTTSTNMFGGIER